MNRTHARAILVLTVAAIAALMALTPAAATAQEPTPTPTPIPVMVIDVSPGILNLASDGEEVTVHTDVPYEDVYTAEIYFENVNEIDTTISSWRSKADNQGNFVANFTMEEIEAIEPKLGENNVVVQIVIAGQAVRSGEQLVMVIDSDVEPASDTLGVRKGKKK